MRYTFGVGIGHEHVTVPFETISTPVLASVVPAATPPDEMISKARAVPPLPITSMLLVTPPLETMARMVPGLGWLLPIPFYFMELLVGLVQAMVFMLLTAVFTLLICHHEAEPERT